MSRRATNFRLSLLDLLFFLIQSLMSTSASCSGTDGYRDFTYCPPMSDRFQNIAKKFGVTSYITTRGTLGDILINLKDRRNDVEKSGIYEIECKECVRKYRGKTGRRFELRWKEHEAALRNQNRNQSAIADHCLCTGHKIGEKRVLKEVSSTLHLNAWESLFIQAGENLCNKDDAPIKSELFDKALSK